MINFDERFIPLHFRNLSGNALKVLFCIIDHYNIELEKAFPGRKKISEVCNLSLPTVDGCVIELKDCQIIAKERQYRQNGSDTTNDYYLKCPLIKKVVLPPKEKKKWRSTSPLRRGEKNFTGGGKKFYP